MTSLLRFEVYFEDGVAGKPQRDLPQREPTGTVNDCPSSFFLVGQKRRRIDPRVWSAPRASVTVKSDASFRRRGPKGNGGTIFPVRRGAAFVPVELANFAKLSHHVRAFLILPLMVAGTGQRLLLLR